MIFSYTLSHTKLNDWIHLFHQTRKNSGFPCKISHSKPQPILRDPRVPKSRLKKCSHRKVQSLLGATGKRQLDWLICVCMCGSGRFESSYLAKGEAKELKKFFLTWEAAPWAQLCASYHLPFYSGQSQGRRQKWLTNLNSIQHPINFLLRVNLSSQGFIYLFTTEKFFLLKASWEPVFISNLHQASRAFIFLTSHLETPQLPCEHLSLKTAACTHESICDLSMCFQLAVLHWLWSPGFGSLVLSIKCSRGLGPAPC